MDPFAIIFMAGGATAIVSLIKCALTSQAAEGAGVALATQIAPSNVPIQ